MVGGGAGARPVVAIGGHGTAVTLKAARRYAGLLTGVVSWPTTRSSGRLRELLNIVALGTSANAWWPWPTRTPRWPPPSSAATTRGS